MKSRFNVVPIETDTTILFQQEGKLDEFSVRFEIWSWDGIEAESIIFLNADVVGLTDQEIKTLARKSPIVKEGSAMTLNRSTDFIFCNFNFE
ncbi:MAG: hypothetical protein AB1Z31_01635 [Desulfobacterales bacterium]